MSENDKYEPIVLSDEDANGLTNALQQAAQAKLAIENDSKTRYNELGKEFADFMVDRVTDDFKYNVAAALGLYATIPPDLKASKLEKRRNAALRSFFKGMFNKTTNLVLYKDDGWPKENSASKLFAFIKNLFALMWISKDIPEVKMMLDSVGLEINFRKPVDDISDGSDETEADRKSRSDILNAGIDTLKETVEKTSDIEENIYPLIPENLKYDEGSNPKGIKKSQFSNLANVNMKKMVLAQNGDEDKVKELDRRTSETLFYSSLNQKLLFDTYEQIK